MSLGLFGLLIVWLIDGSPITKIKAFYKNKPALIISSIYLLTVIGLLWTSNFEFAIDDLRRKLPLFFIPFYVAGFSPITKKELHLLLKIFIVGVLISTLWSLFVYLGGLNVNIIDKRDLSRFNSHIRFGLAIALAIFFSLYFLFKNTTTKGKLSWLLVSLWLVASLFLFSLITGLVVFGAAGGVLLVVFGVRHSSILVKAFSLILFLGTLSGAFLFTSSSVQDFQESVIPKTIEDQLYSKAGHKYQKDEYTEASRLKENGYFIEKHIAWGEFKDAWNSKSTIKFDSLDLKGQKLKNTLMRFVTSKGQRKDAEAINKLSAKEVSAIERGTPNHSYLEMNTLSVRMHKIMWELHTYNNNRDLNGHSILMRWEYWNTAIDIIKNNLLIGVGTGDVQDAFNRQYNLENSTLTNQYRLRTHNQYLAYCVSFGLPGLFWFLCCLFYPTLRLQGYKNYLYLAFFSIALLSMMGEDTLEVQAGINFFAFFNTVLTLNYKKRAS